MAKNYGTAFDIDGKYAPGATHDAGTRRFSNKFTVTANTDTLQVARIRKENCVSDGIIRSTVNQSAINFTLGTVASPAKYATAFAGPAANASVRIPIIPAMAATLTTESEDLILTPSAAMTAGTIVADVITSKM